MIPIDDREPGGRPGTVGEGDQAQFELAPQIKKGLLLTYVTSVALRVGVVTGPAQPADNIEQAKSAAGDIGPVRGGDEVDLRQVCLADSAQIPGQIGGQLGADVQVKGVVTVAFETLPMPH